MSHNQGDIVEVRQLDPATRKVYRCFTYHVEHKHLDVKISQIEMAYNMANTLVLVNGITVR